MFQRFLAVSLALSTITVQAAPVSGQGTWETTLLGRDLDGNASTFEAYYDSVLDITWLANANAGAGSAFDDGHDSNDGRMSWENANAWAASLTVDGIGGWRLPETSPVSGTSFNVNFAFNGTTDRGYNIGADGTASDGFLGNELTHLFYQTLGNPGVCDPLLSGVYGCTKHAGPAFSNTGAFSGLETYWASNPWAYGTAYPYAHANFAFNFQFGSVDSMSGSGHMFAWAVRDGDVSAVPIPAAAWLFASALGVFGYLAKRKDTA